MSLPHGYEHRLNRNLQGLKQMHANIGVGPLLAGAALREHHRILDDALQLEDWSRAEALFLQVPLPCNRFSADKATTSVRVNT